MKVLLAAGRRFDARPVGEFPYTKERMEVMLTAQQDPRGRRILMVLKTGRVVPIRLRIRRQSRAERAGRYPMRGR